MVAYYGVLCYCSSIAQRESVARTAWHSPGISRMKALAQSYVWWPNMDSVSSCSTCQSMRSNPSPVKIHPWIFPGRPWSRIHVDFAGPISSCMYLVVIDAYSKFPEVVKMSTTSAKATQLWPSCVTSSAGMVCPELLCQTMGPNSPLQNWNNIAPAMEYCTVLEQGTSHLQMVKQNVSYRFWNQLLTKPTILMQM